MTKSNATLSVAAHYIKQGFVAPFPLQQDTKSPPAKGMTGNIPTVTGAQIKEAWQGIRPEDNRNIAIRLQVHSDKPFDIISIDVDNYGEKRGEENIRKVENESGSLNRDQIPRSSRRGPESPSGQYFFRVPKGLKWEGKVCADVEVIQMTHRYAAVYPSVVDGLQYNWYVGDQEVEIPDVDDLPELPEAWVTRLRRGKVRNRVKAHEIISGYSEAVHWMEENFTDCHSESMSGVLQRISAREDLDDDMAGGAHDTMVRVAHAIVRYGVEGHVGTVTALERLYDAFLDEVTGREGEGWRNEAACLREFEDAVVGEVNLVIDEVEAGVVTIQEDLSNLVVPKDSLSGISAATEGKPDTVEWQKYRNTDYDHAKMFFDYWGHEVLAANDSGSQTYAVWDRSERRFIWRNRNEIYDRFNAAVPARLRLAAEHVAQEAEKASDEEKKEELAGIAASLHNRASGLQNTRQMNGVLSQLHSIEEIRVRVDHLDSNNNLVGIDGGKTLDISEVPDGDYLRTSQATDLLTMSTKVPLIEGHTHEAWDDFLERVLPDEEVRLFTRKVMGYAFADGNPSKKAVFLSGASNTGKSTMLLACQAALGDYASPVQTSKVYGRRQEGPTPEMIAAIDQLMVTMSETGDGDTLSSNAIKQITGNDQLQLRGAHKNETINKAPRFVPYSSTNSPPKVTDADQALKGRILVIPFDYPQPVRRVAHEEDVVANPAISVAVLAWMFQGYKDYVEEGLEPDTWPRLVRERSDLFSASTNIVDQFVTEALRKTGVKTDYIEGPSLHSRWKLWAANEGLSREESEISRSMLYQKLKSNGFPVALNTKIKGRDGSVTLLRGYLLA